MLLVNPCISNKCAHLQVKKIHTQRGFLFLMQQEAQIGIPELVSCLSYALSLVPSERLKWGPSVGKAPRMFLFLCGPSCSWTYLLWEPSCSIPRETGTVAWSLLLEPWKSYRFTSVAFCSLKQSQRSAQVQGSGHVLCCTGEVSENCGHVLKPPQWATPNT